jgi:hypothetical protein
MKTILISLLLAITNCLIYYNDLFEDFEFNIGLTYSGDDNSHITLTKVRDIEVFNDLFGQPDTLKAKIHYTAVNGNKQNTTGFMRIFVSTPP